MWLTVISYIPVAIGLYAIGFITLLKNTKNKINLWFAIFTFMLASWQVALFLADFILLPGPSLWSLRVASCLGVLTFPPLLYFCVLFPTTSKRFSRNWLLGLSAPAVIFALLSFTPWLIPAVDLSDKSAQLTGAGTAYSLESIYLIAGYLFALGVLFSKYRRVEARQKSQILLVIYGMAVAVAANALTGFVLIMLNVGSNYSNLLGSVSFLIFVATTSYAIIQHKLFDIRLAIARTIGFIVTVSLAGFIYVLLILGLEILFTGGSRLYPTDTAGHIALLLIPTIFVGFTFYPIEQFIARLTKRVFYQNAYDLRDTLDSLSDVLVVNNELDALMERSFELINGAIKPSQAYFAVFDEKGVYRELAVNMAHPKSVRALMSKLRHIEQNPVVRDELSMQEIPKNFIDLDIYVVLCLGSRVHPSGVFLFGPKQNGRIYSQQDIDLLRIGAKNVEVAISNAKKYEQISHFAETMRQEVTRATSQLRKANLELKTLDALKDDFISMASHQLRSPATSVHEVIEMLNHSRLSEAEKDRLLELAETSSERLVSVITDMLNIARIQAGQLIVDKSPVALGQIVEDVVHRAAILASHKNIKITVLKPSQVIKIPVDRSKITEAWSNYVENAITYSPKGSTITINLTKEDERIIFEVADEGIGVPSRERAHLFEKFYRAGNAREQVPDGNGIGLFLARGVARSHEGDAYYKPKKSGSVFGFWLPT